MMAIRAIISTSVGHEVKRAMVGLGARSLITPIPLAPPLPAPLLGADIVAEIDRNSTKKKKPAKNATFEVN